MRVLERLSRVRGPHLQSLRNTQSRFLASKTSSPSTTSKPRRKLKSLSLDHFIQRQRVLGLYRSIVRNLFRIPRSDQQKRNELISYARGEFERNKNVQDITHIRYLISTGKTEMQGMERYIEEIAQR